MCFGCYVEWIKYSNRPRRNDLKTLWWGWEFHPNFCYSYVLTWRNRFQIGLNHNLKGWRKPEVFDVRPDVNMFYIGPLHFGWKK